MKKIATGLFAALMVGAIAAPAFAAADPKEAQAIETPDDVVIRAKRMKLYEMRMEMVQVEDRFYAKYNELNTDDDYDVVCSLVARTGEIRKTRKCRPAFVEGIQSVYARSVVGMFNSAIEGPPFHIPSTPDAQLFSMWHEMKDHALKVINKSPELRAMIRHREALERSYRAEQKIRLNGRLLLLE
jgi:hypothetical protein